jgi:hypothetical protein
VSGAIGLEFVATYTVLIALRKIKVCSEPLPYRSSTSAMSFIPYLKMLLLPTRPIALGT